MTRRVLTSVTHFDREANRWTAAYGARSAGGHALRERLRRVEEALAGRPPGLVLDVGCGTGVASASLAARGWQALGLDAAPAMASHAGAVLRAHPSGLGAAVADAGSLPVRSASVDAVVCLGVLDRLPDPAAAVRELARVLRPGGLVVMTVPNRSSPYARWSSSVWRPAVGTVKRRLGRTGLDSSAHLFSRRGVERLVGSGALEVLSCRGYWFNLLLSPLDELAPRSAERLAVHFERLHRTRAHWLGAGWVVVARKPS